MPASEDALPPALPPDLEALLHDLRGPLNAAVMHVEVAKRLGPEDAGVRQALQTVQQEVARLAVLLPLAFAVCGLEVRQRVTVDLEAVVQRVLQEYAPGQVSAAGGLWPKVRGDPDLLALAIGHLVRNAVEATARAGGQPPAPHVSVEPGPPGTATVVVRDWGPGFKSTNPKVMVRLSASTKPSAAGVGLVTADRVARLHGGALEFATPSEGGAEARLTLPTE